MKNVTIKTISESTNFSITTVSRVLNGVSKKFRISEETEKLILEASKKLGYTPNQTAINLRLNKSFAIGLVIPSLANPFFADIASLVAQSLYGRGYAVLVTDCGEEEGVEINSIKSLVARNIDGIVVIPSGKDRKHYELLQSQNIPIVFIDRYFEDLDISYVATDHYMGAYQMADYLIKQGHKKIACIQGRHEALSNRERLRGFKDALKENNLSEFYVGGSSFTSENGYIETKLMLLKKEKPTAVFALSDTILLGVLKALYEDGYHVPADISVVTSDNSIYLDFLHTPVTSIAQPISDIAQIAIRLLLDEIKAKSDPDNGKVEQKKMLLNPSVIYRKSVKNITATNKK